MEIRGFVINVKGFQDGVRSGVRRGKLLIGFWGIKNGGY